MTRLASNAIYYTHTQRWGFGWRKPLDAAAHSALLDVISEFPGDYDIKADPAAPAGWASVEA